MDGIIVFVWLTGFFNTKYRLGRRTKLGQFKNYLLVHIESLTADCVYGGKGLEEKFNCFAICQAV